MAVYVHKHWNEAAVVLKEGVGVRLSKGEKVLYVVNEQGKRIAQFFVKSVKRHWIE